MLNIIEGPATLTEMVKNCITSEMREDGLLSDVETFIPSYRLDEPIEEPCIWLFEHETTIYGKSGGISSKLGLQTPFEFVCLVYDETDIEQSEIQGKNLAGRVAASIAKNYNRIFNGKLLSSSPVLEAIYPVGTVEINEKSDKAVATSVRINFIYYVDWRICCKKNKKE